LIFNAYALEIMVKNIEIIKYNTIN